MPLGPGASPNGLVPTLGKHLPDIRREVDYLACGKDFLQGAQYRRRWHPTKSSDMPELIELKAKDGHVGWERRLIDDALGSVIRATGRSFATEARGPLIGTGVVFGSWLFV